jgi:TIR domain
MAYQYDVFLSYSRRPISANWINHIFLPLFKDYLEGALGRNVKIFQDIQGIEGNDAWDSRLKNALAHSKAMVCVWLPQYFNSEWCLRELSVFMKREQTYKFRTNQQPQGLICPINIFDGEHFPDYVQRYQYLDCIKYNRTGEGFKQTEGYNDLQEILQNFAYDVAKAVNIAPEWKEDFLSKKFIDNAYTELITKQEQVKMITAPKL